MLDKINDDCILEIVKYLKLKDEISLAQVCTRFKPLLAPIWARRHTKLILDLFEAPLSAIEFRVLIESIYGTIRGINVKLIPAALFAVLTEFTFHQAVELRFSQMPPLYLSDNDIIAMQASFPNLRSFIPHGGFTGKYIVRWTKLENITLSFCRRFQLNHFRDIIRELPLKSLYLDLFPSTDTTIEPLGREFSRCFRKFEVLIINSYEFNWITQNTNPFDNLKQLTIRDRIEIDDVFFWIRENKAGDVVELETAHSSIEEEFNEPRPLQWYLYTNLKKLKLIGQPNTMALIDVTRNLNQNHLKNLREVFLYSCVLHSTSDIIDFLKCSHRIEFVSFERCHTEFPLLQLIVRDMLHVERTVPLVVNFFANNYVYAEGMPLLIEVIGTNDLLKITAKPIINHSFDPLNVIFK